jgi:hypothetical protein
MNSRINIWTFCARTSMTLDWPKTSSSKFTSKHRIQSTGSSSKSRSLITSSANKIWMNSSMGSLRVDLYNSPIFYLPKTQGQGLRIVQDFRELHQNSHCDKYSNEIMECISNISQANSTIFTMLDLTSGFRQRQLDKDSQKLIAFTIPGKGQFHWITSPMGLLGRACQLPKIDGRSAP